MPLLQAEDVKAYYVTRAGTVRAVDGVNLEVDSDTVLGVAGESGCGKSTLINVLMMNVRPPLRFLGGKVVLNGLTISEMERERLKRDVWGKLVALVPQAALNALMPTMRVRDFVIDVVREHQELPEKEIVDMARKRFEELGLPPSALDLYPHELSGGMRQRAVIAVATLLNPKLLLADEVTSALDVSTQRQVLELLMDLRRRRFISSIVFVTHDIAVLRQIADEIAIMYAGKIVEKAPTEDIILDPLHPYTAALVNSVLTPEPEVRRRGLSYLPGEPPSLINPPPGCRFHPRCPKAMSICSKEEPKLVKASGGR
ncbi:MAG: ABC transporter ATP-binding protein, partial [Thermofilaceae archaeon]